MWEGGGVDRVGRGGESGEVVDVNVRVRGGVGKTRNGGTRVRGRLEREREGERGVWRTERKRAGWGVARGGCGLNLLLGGRSLYAYHNSKLSVL